MDLKALNEWEKLGLSFAISLLVFRIVFFNESSILVVRSAFAAYWVLVLPGIGATYLFRGLAFIERLAVSVPISAALIGISSYYLGLLGVHVKYSVISMPVIFISVSMYLMLREVRRIGKSAP